MCDYSLETVKTRPARVGDKLITRRFWSATGGFCPPEDIHLAVCLLPGTELSFAYEVKRSCLWSWSNNVIHHKTAIFRQVNLDSPSAHHDALEFPDGEIVLLTYLMEGQEATVLQLPATAAGSKGSATSGIRVASSVAGPHVRPLLGSRLLEALLLRGGRAATLDRQPTSDVAIVDEPRRQRRAFAAKCPAKPSRETPRGLRR